MTVFQRLKELHPDLQSIVWDGSNIVLMFPLDAGIPTEDNMPWSKDEFRPDSESYLLMDKLEQILMES